ncbi:MAG: hypothetical protein J6U21_14955 [Bacteroidales bacterium]|nr:hypothetical protein [Bacteroidales bacterium]
MKKILVLVFAMVMCANCRAQIPWGTLLKVAKDVGPIIASGMALKDLCSSTHIKELNMGKELCDINDYQRALDYLTQINEEDHDAVRVEAYYYRRLCYMGMEDYDKANKLFDKVIHFEISWNTWEAEKIVDFKSKVQSLKDIGIAMNLHSVNTENFIKGIIAYQNDNDYATAFDYFAKIDENDKKQLRIMAHYYKGNCRWCQMDGDKATINYQRAIRLNVSDDVMYSAEAKECQQRAQKMTTWIKGYEILDTYNTFSKFIMPLWMSSLTPEQFHKPLDLFDK